MINVTVMQIQQAKKEKENARQKRLREQALQEAEDLRLANEQKEREAKRLKAVDVQVSPDVAVLKAVVQRGGLDGLPPFLDRRGRHAELPWHLPARRQA